MVFRAELRVDPDIISQSSLGFLGSPVVVESQSDDFISKPRNLIVFRHYLSVTYYLSVTLSCQLADFSDDVILKSGANVTDR